MVNYCFLDVYVLPDIEDHVTFCVTYAIRSFQSVTNGIVTDNAIKEVHAFDNVIVIGKIIEELNENLAKFISFSKKLNIPLNKDSGDDFEEFTQADFDGELVRGNGENDDSGDSDSENDVLCENYHPWLIDFKILISQHWYKTRNLFCEEEEGEEYGHSN
ncbi:Hypothetical predicted protein [Octopus vulgaris]|uniref:Uncharacterized protein n=1 Tax=Octopus vulgaris TaxID=6645 RepID=A0AA36FC96_OCTVU|nr:Hypothetical predicted protein [Octopus vulgaris]